MHTFSPLSTKPVLVERKRRAPVSPGTTGLFQWFRASGHLIGVVVVGTTLVGTKATQVL